MRAFFTVKHEKHEEICETFDKGNCVICNIMTSQAYEIEDGALYFSVHICSRCEPKWNKNISERIIKMLFENIKYYILGGIS